MHTQNFGHFGHRFCTQFESSTKLIVCFYIQGDFKEALNRKCFENEEISDARRPLYKVYPSLLYIQGMPSKLANLLLHHTTL